MGNFIFTSESVSKGHPDKICDQISDAILDAYLAKDKNSKVAVECFITDNLLVIGGEVHSSGSGSIDPVAIAKETIKEIGYDGTNGFDPENATYVNAIHEQSNDIRRGVDREEEENQGAGDQGIMFGFATNETDEYLPVPIVLANTTMAILSEEGSDDRFGPDAKCQYSVEYEDGKPKEIKTIVFSLQHKENIEPEVVENFFKEWVFYKLKRRLRKLDYLFENSKNIKFLINPTGRFVIGGPQGDTGLTGRKIIVDTYGGFCPHGGGAFSGKDPSKVDRSGAYAARYIAKNLVAAGVADSILIQLSYAIGVAKPISIFIDAKPTKHSATAIKACIEEIFPLTPYQIINELGLKAPIYKPTATFGHFSPKPLTGDILTDVSGPEYPWERLDKVNEVKKFLKI